jgi:hypothetical protein
VAIVGGGNDAPNNIWRLNADQTVTRLTNSPIPVGILQGNVVVDPVSGNFLIVGYGQLWRLDPRGAGSWTLLGATPSAVASIPNQDSLVSSSISNYGVVTYITCRGSTCNMWLYKP